ncbi:MAG TPA: MAPEG family protein [Candidatus Binataceae bacterium]|nr:MAPEG family protein [Candidatus Binataceae bacterium]
MSWLSLITVAALIEYFVFVFMTGQARVKYKVEAPATTGDPVFERYYRVQQNTLEQLVIFIPALWLFAEYVGPRSAFVLGLIFLAGRALYARGYIREPSQRQTGAMATFAANGILVLGSLIGLIVHAL